ncbi:MAG: hypothetical protein WCA17_04235 [Burkholderiales bacterium]
MRRTAGRPAGKRGPRSRIAALLIFGLLAVGGVFAHYWVATLTYYPTAKVALPGGFAFSVVQQAQPDRAACGEANERFLGPLESVCKDCKVVYARCQRAIDGADLLLMTEASPSFYTVIAPGLRMRLHGPAKQLGAVCDGIAAQLVRSGRANATCLRPRDPTEAAR